MKKITFVQNDDRLKDNNFFYAYNKFINLEYHIREEKYNFPFKKDF